MKVALAQLNYHIGNFEDNTAKIIKAIKKAKKQGADLVVFAELAVCGYPPRDFLEFKDFMEECKKSIEKIATECKGIAAIVGAPSENPVAEGKDLFNSAYFLEDGKIKSIHNKGLLPNYDVFDEYRYFEPSKDFKVVEYKGVKIALTICEDTWDISDNLMYNICPMDVLSEQNAEIVINISASPFDYNHEDEREKMILQNISKYSLPFIYVNHVGAQTELIFDGGSIVANSDGHLIGILPHFREDLQIYDIRDIINRDPRFARKKKQNLGRKADTRKKIKRIHDALILGIQDYFRKLSFQKAIVGLSGGIDSAVTIVMAMKALGKENVQALLMPSQFSSSGSVNDSIDLCKRAGIEYQMIKIEDIYNAFEKQLQPFFKDLPFDATEENIQARIRGILLMGFSNKFGPILLNTSNKSENAVGYGTLYGDMCGGLSVIGDLYKTEVYDLADYINRVSENSVIPLSIIKKAPSAELRPDQKDTDSLPPYELLDSILYQYIEKRQGPAEIIAMGYESGLVKRILKMVNQSEYKRYQAPPILRVSEKAFGIGRRVPIVGKYLTV